MGRGVRGRGGKCLGQDKWKSGRPTLVDKLTIVTVGRKEDYFRQCNWEGGRRERRNRREKGREGSLE